MRDTRLRRWPAFLVFLVVPFGPTVALSQESRAGVVTTIEGQALLARPTLSQPVGLKFKDDLFARDRVETKEDSIVRVLLGGKALVTIRELSVFTVTEEPGRAAVDLRSGKLALGVAKSLLRPGEVIEIRTPNAVAGIRGSLLVAEVGCVTEIGRPLSRCPAVGGVPQSAFTALQATVPITIASVGNPNLTVSLSPNQTVSVSGAGAAATVGPVLNITPAQAQQAAATAAAPRQAGQATTSLLDSQMTTTQVAQAVGLASLIAPASQTLLKTAGVVSVVPTPSTAQLGVNETEAGAVAEVVESVNPDVPDITIIDTTKNVPPGDTLKTYTGTSSRPGTSPVVLISNSQVSSPGSLLAVAPGADATLNGPLLEMSGPSVQASTLTVGANVVDIQGQLADTTTSALLQFDPTQVVSGNEFVRVSNGGNLFLAGPLVSAVGTSFRVGDPTANVFSFLSILDGSTVIGTSSAPLLSFDGSSVDTSGNIVSIRRSPSTSTPSTLILLGPLLSAVNGSSFNTSSLGLGAGCCSIVSVTQGGLLFATTTSPLVQISGSTVNAGPDAQSGGSIINLSDTFTNAPPAELVAPATVFLAGPLLSVDNSTVTALFHLLRVGNSDLISTSQDPLIRISGSTVTLGGTDPFTHATSAARLLNLSMSNSDTPASLTLSGPLFSAVNSTLSSTAELFGIFGGTLTTTGTTTPLISLNGGTVTSGAHLIHVSGLSSGVSVPSLVDLSDPLLSVTGSSINARGNLVRIADGASLSSTTTSPLISFQGGSFTGGPFQSGAGASLLRMFSQTGQSPTELWLAGPYLVASGATFTSPDAPPFNIADGAVITSTGTAPFASFTGGSATTQSSFFNLDNNTSTAGTPPTVGSGDTPQVSIAGTLIKGTDTSFTVQNGVFLRLHNGVSLIETGASPLLDLAGSSPGGVAASAPSNNFIVLFAGHGQPAPTLTLGGSFLSAKNAMLTNGDPTANTQGFLFVGDSATVTGTGSSPLLSFDASSVDTSGGLLSLRRSTSANKPTMLTLSGPLFAAVNGSSFNTTSLGFGASFGTGGQACCTAFGVSQGAQLSSTTPSPLIQLTSSTFNVGPDAQSGNTFFGLSDTGPPDGIVAPSRVSLAGPLLSASGSTITALFDLLNVTRSSMTSTSPNPLSQLDESTVSLGGTNPFAPGTPTSGRLLLVISSGTAGTSASPASVSLAGPVLSANNSTLTMTSDVVGVLNGASLTSTTSLPLLQLVNTALTAGTASTNGQALQVSNLGGPGGAVPASATLNGPLLVASNGSSLNLTGGLLVVRDGGQATVIGSGAPFASITGGTHSIASNAGHAMFQLFGRGTATAVDPETGLILGTDKPLQQGGVLLETSGATVTGQQVVAIDTALLEATAPLLNLKTGSVMTSSVDAINLNSRANVVSLSGSDLVRLDASVLNVSNGALARVAGGSKLTVGGNLVNLLNGATLTIFNGPLITVSGSSFVNITGSLISFGGTGGNKVNITNSLCPCSIIGGVPVALQNGASAANVQITNPIKNTGLGQLNLSSANAALAVVNGANTKLKVSGK